ncbi:hypothetical protein LTR56_024168 [Elasticomyces elasticus]|nr:hypothetical protein LTR56_024168 [Elasticomyces elasticus]KAK3622286.1 hypothetical protein LTR22_024872 [Elasticomyces elasticus]KAK4906434.1 hypothetical protein LTR49_024403 [Elasticomyces elasticus]KAK5754855.1 hypothetical protein LTS12_015071 [Elasticomyces elasticus]
MAKTKTSKQTKQAMVKKESPEQLYAAALELVEQSSPEEALKKAKKLWLQVQNGSVTEALPALNLLGEISIELGDGDGARGYFEKAVALDPSGEIPEAMGGGAEKFLWLAQLCEEGGQASVDWFERGVKALQVEIAAIEGGKVKGYDEEALLMMRVEKKHLSWEDDAEAKCDSLVMEAMIVEDETSPEVLQTLASVRLSQLRKDDARAALTRSLQGWIDLDPEDSAVPDFATRVSLARLLMEAEMEDEAMQVLHRLVADDDQSVEAWYQGGWCQYLIAEKMQNSSKASKGGDTEMNGADSDLVTLALNGSRNWLKMALKLCDLLDYEDERLFEHAKSVAADLDQRLGPDEKQDGEDEEFEEWGGIVDSEAGAEDEDELMQDL